MVLIIQIWRAARHPSGDRGTDTKSPFAAREIFISICADAYAAEWRFFMYHPQVKQIADEIDSRIGRLKAHRYDPIDVTGNHVEELNQAVSKVIGSALIGELESLRTFIDQTEGKEMHRS